MLMWCSFIGQNTIKNNVSDTIVNCVHNNYWLLLVAMVWPYFCHLSPFSLLLFFSLLHPTPPPPPLFPSSFLYTSLLPSTLSLPSLMWLGYEAIVVCRKRADVYNSWLVIKTLCLSGVIDHITPQRHSRLLLTSVSQRQSSSGCCWLQLAHLSPSAQYSYVRKLGCWYKASILLLAVWLHYEIKCPFSVLMQETFLYLSNDSIK